MIGCRPYPIYLHTPGASKDLINGCQINYLNSVQYHPVSSHLRPLWEGRGSGIKTAAVESEFFVLSRVDSQSRAGTVSPVSVPQPGDTASSPPQYCFCLKGPYLCSSAFITEAQYQRQPDEEKGCLARRVESSSPRLGHTVGSASSERNHGRTYGERVVSALAWARQDEQSPSDLRTSHCVCL